MEFLNIHRFIFAVNGQVNIDLFHTDDFIFVLFTHPCELLSNQAKTETYRIIDERLQPCNGGCIKHTFSMHTHSLYLFT